MCTLRALLRACWMNSRGALRCDQLARQAGGHVHAPLIGDARAGAPPQLDRGLVAADLHADLLQQPVGVRLHRAQAFLGEQLVGRQRTRDVGRCERRLRAARLARRTGAAAEAACGRVGVSHGLPSW